MTLYETLSIIFMGLAFVSSVVSLIISIVSASKVRTINQRSKFYDDIFKERILIKLPNLYNEYVEKEINIPNLAVEREFEEFLANFRREIIALKFIDQKFYKKIDDYIISIEDTVVRISNHSNEFVELKQKLYNNITSMYKVINKYFR